LIKQNPYISDTINLLIAIDVENTKELTRYLDNDQPDKLSFLNTNKF